MASTRQTVLSLYKQLMRESRKFTLYSYREYFVRRIREDFHQNRAIQDSAKIGELIKTGQENLEVIRRQVIIGNLYTPETPSIIDDKRGSSIPSR